MSDAELTDPLGRLLPGYSLGAELIRPRGGGTGSNIKDSDIAETLQNRPNLLGVDQEQAIGNAVNAARGIVPYGNPQRKENLAAWHEGSHLETKNPDGTPRVFYHGTTNDFSEFDPSYATRANDGMWLTNSPHYADWIVNKNGKTYTYDKNANIMPVHVNMKNPYVIDILEEGKKVADQIGEPHPKTSLEAQHLLAGGMGWDEAVSHISDMAKSKKHDGLILKNFDDNYPRGITTAYLPFHPHQIKSAAGNQGTFDSSNPDITKARGGDVKLHHAGGGRTLNSNADSDVDTSYLGNLLRGLQSIPETAYDYLKNTSYSQMGSDALDLGKNVYHDITEHPIENLLGALPIVGSGMAAHDAYKLNDRIKQAYASGNHEDAKKLERALVLSSLGAIPIFGELSSVGSSAARMAEEAMLHGAAETGSRAIANSIPRDVYQVAENMASHKINQALDAAKKRMFSDMGDDHKVRSDVGRATGGRAGYATLGGVPEDDIAQAVAVAKTQDTSSLPGAVIRSYEPTWKDRIANWMLGNEKPSPEREQFVEGLIGSRGLGSTGMSLSDFVPVAGSILPAQEAVQQGDYKTAAMSMIPMEGSIAKRLAANEAQTLKGLAYETAQHGPFYRISPRTAGADQPAISGFGQKEWTGSPADIRGTGPSAYGTSQLDPITGESSILMPPAEQNAPLQAANQYVADRGFSAVTQPEMPRSSLAKQSAIGRTFQLASEDSPAYKTAIFDAYQRAMPEVVEQSGAQNYDQLLEASYRQMAKETDEQFKKLPLRFSFHKAGEGDYENSAQMLQDVHNNNHLFVFQGGDRHDFLHNIDPDTGLNENEKFRAVHDAFGHAILGNTFGAQGEERAWGLHSQMYSPLARLAMTAETRGQNSFVNYTPVNMKVFDNLGQYEMQMVDALRKGDKNAIEELKKVKKEIMGDWQFAPQKSVLLPPEFLSTEYNGGMPEYVRSLVKPKTGTTFSSSLTHFSRDPNMTMTDPTLYGTGLKGDERDRIFGMPGGVANRSYFYLGDPRRVSPEPGLGSQRYSSSSENLYNWNQDPLGLWNISQELNRAPATAKNDPAWIKMPQAKNDVERLAKEYGYSGIANTKHRYPMAVMFDPTPVQRVGRKEGGRIGYATLGGVPEDDIEDAKNIAYGRDAGARDIENKIKGLATFQSGLDMQVANPSFHTGLDRPSMGGAGMPSNMPILHNRLTNDEIENHSSAIAEAMQNHFGVPVSVSKSKTPYGVSHYVKPQFDLPESETPFVIRVSDHAAWVPRLHQIEHHLYPKSNDDPKKFINESIDATKNYGQKVGLFSKDEFVPLIGDVYHQTFGKGTIINSQPDFAKVDFGDKGIKNISSRFLQPVADQNINKARGGDVRMHHAGGGRAGYATLGGVPEDDIEDAKNIAYGRDAGARDIENKIKGLATFQSGLDMQVANPSFHTGLDRPSTGGAGMPTRILAGNPSNIQEEITVIRPTVDNPQRIAYPGVYERPDIMAAKAAARVAPEDPALKQLFGVTRDDLYQMSKDRKGTAVPDIMLGKGKTPDTVDAIMNQRNAQRLVDALGEAERYPALTKGMDAWYTMDPLYHAMVKELGPELAAKRYTQMNTRMGMMSPGSDVVSEIQRGLGADYMTEQGRFPEFSKMGGIGKYVRPSSFPSELLSMPGHPYHSTSHMGPMAKFNETGELDMGSPKVPLYIQSSNAPELGQQTRWPVPDAHFARGVGMGETRTAKDFKPSMNMAEYRPFGEWYYQNVAQPLGLEGVPAQARQWGLMGHATGVETDIGAPKLEMLAQHIMESARRNGVDPITARNEIIRGNMYNHGGRTLGNNAIDNAIRMARGGEASDGINEPSILDTASPIEVPHSLQELQNWKKTHPRPLNKHAMDDIFSLRLSGVEGGEPIAMPANLDELLADLRRRHHASGGRLHYEDGGEADGGDPRGNEAGMADRSQSDSNYGGDPRGNERGFADMSRPDNNPSDVDRFSFGRDFDVSGGNYTGHEMPTGLVGYSEQRMNTPYEGSLLSATMDPSNAFGMGYGSLVGKQNTRAGAAGLLGSAMGESGQELDPSAINAGSIGMFQHTGSRARDLRDVLGIGQGVRGNELRDALAGSQMPQLGFALNEIATNPAYADTRNAMRTGTNAADVADVALENFERPSLENQIKSAPSREAYARGIMAGRPSGATLGVGQYDGTPSSIRDALRSGADLAKTQRGRFGASDIYAANNAGNVGANALVGSYDNSTLSGDTADDTLENAMPRTPVESFEDPALIAAYNAQYGLSGPKNAYADMTLGQRTPDVTTNNPFINAVQGFGGFLADRFTPSYGLNSPEYNKISQAVYPNRDQSSDYRGDHGVQQQAINQAMALAASQKVAAPYTTELGTYNQQLPTVDGMTAEQWAAAHTGGDMSKVHGRIKYVNGAPRLEYYTI